MSPEQIAELERLHAAGTSGPWFVCELNDDVAMTALAVTSSAALGALDEEGGKCHDWPWPAEEIVAATLVQSPRYAVSADRRWRENAELIAAMRNALPELLRLAQLAGEAAR